MVPTYENRPEDLDVYENRTLTFPPHLHEGVELFYVESGAITVTCAGCTRTLYPVSYTHLDVYKRQPHDRSQKGGKYHGTCHHEL